MLLLILLVASHPAGEHLAARHLSRRILEMEVYRAAQATQEEAVVDGLQLQLYPTQTSTGSRRRCAIADDVGTPYTTQSVPGGARLFSCSSLPVF